MIVTAAQPLNVMMSESRVMLNLFLIVGPKVKGVLKKSLHADIH